MAVRQVGPQDREFFMRMVHAKRYQEGPMEALSGIRRKEKLLAAYEQSCDSGGQGRFLIRDDPAGFLVILPQQVESLTQQRQDEILDWGGEFAPLLEVAELEARQRHSEYLVARIYPGEEQAFQALGFKAELTRVIKKVEPQPFDGPFGFRVANAQDRLFIANLNSRGMHFYVPAHRGVDQDELAIKMMSRYLNLDFGPQSAFLGLLVLENRRPFGYILLRLGERLDQVGEPAAYLYDLNLRAEYWGKGAGRLLGNYTQCQLAERQIPYLVGDISRINERALQVAVHSIGFQAEWVRWGKPVASA